MQIQTLEQLRALHKTPSERAVLKELTHIDKHIQRFISLSPFLAISSGNLYHEMDCSPRGGEAGFVKILDAMPTLGEIIQDQTKMTSTVETREEMLKRYLPEL